MSIVFGIIVVAVWLVAVFAFVRVAITWLAVMRAAPSGQKFDTALALGFWNFTAVEQRIGPPAVSLIAAYKQGFFLFFGAILGFMALTVVNIILGNAA